ncbi:MAG: hypothetical protein COU81_03760 [Candidatus Portnoybacteria bacterium CG10_big_fil_rev_8_21_14_0_10_36_7]|uniref:Uncharacterized protein n=1 Tax=Candidatus Portnoybacteria bacterium CG10_big_fil_rev_8_21_14_0_10_36_7 TaxID=1974812 RepID=A0A2M8KD80_9BACT|nr:MAG: hypothetical protein COU81_03760 [Candidatus Portnoybacteria bacterium CG10_big_fil_rev_8_21_14_0_10_36_7]
MEDKANIDFETILSITPDVDKVLNMAENIASLKDFRMRRMLENLNPETTLRIKKINEGFLEESKEEIRENEEKMENFDTSILRQAELIKYKKIYLKVGISALRQMLKMIWKQLEIECLLVNRCFYMDRPEPVKHL